MAIGSTTLQHRALRYPALRRPAGFTLLEVALVLAILVTLAALAAPTLQQALQRQKLRAAATQVRGAIATARAEAIGQGETYMLWYEVGADQYKVEPLCDVDAPESQVAGFGEETETQQVRPQREYTLPELVSWLEPSQAVANAVQEFGTSGPADAGDVRILFYPDGSCDSAEMRLANDQGYTIAIHLRGITATAVVSDVERTDKR